MTFGSIRPGAGPFDAESPFLRGAFFFFPLLFLSFGLAHETWTRVSHQTHNGKKYEKKKDYA